jgi:retron-type reverse transcriptase
MSHEWTMKFVEHRVADRRVLGLIQKWLKAGVSEDGKWSESKVGTPQGAVVKLFDLKEKERHRGFFPS